MVDKVLGYTGVFCDGAVLFIEEDIKEVIQRLKDTLDELEENTIQWEPCTKADFRELERNLNSIIPEFEPEVLEPLWVRNQQQKTFKRGKK